MARSQARINIAVWRNRDFTALPGSAQATYWMVLAQPDVNMAGVIAYMPHRWAQFRGDPHRLEDDLETLERGDFLVIDRATHETWIRSFAKNDGALRSPTNRRSMWTSWQGVLSPTIRRRFIEQLQGVNVTVKRGGEEVQMPALDEAINEGWITRQDVTEALAPDPGDTPPDGASHTPSNAPPDTPSDTPSTPHADRDADQAETDTPSDTPSDGGPRTRLPSSSSSSTTPTPARAREAADADHPAPHPPPDGGEHPQDQPQQPDPLEHYRARTIGRLPAKARRAIDDDSASARGKLEAALHAACDEQIPIGRVWAQLNDSDLLAQDVKSVAATASVRIHRAIEEHAKETAHG